MNCARLGTFPPHLAAAGLAAYVALEWLSFIHDYNGLPITPWNPGLGVVFAQMLKRGPLFTLVLFAGLMISQTLVLETPLDLFAVGVTSLIITAIYGAAAFAIRGISDFSPAIARLRDLVIVLVGGTAAAACASTAVFAFLIAQGHVTWNDVEVAALPMFLGDAIGIAVMTPLILRLAQRGMNLLPPRGLRFEFIGHTFFILAIIVVISAGQFEDETRYFYLLFLPVTIAAIHYGLDGACLSLALTQFALVAGLHISQEDAAAFNEFQRLMIVLTTTGLTIGAAVNERQRALDFERASEASLRDMETEAGHAVRLQLVSGMASALAHEINQPMTAARAHVRTAEHILGLDRPDLERAARNLNLAMTQIDHAGDVLSRMREQVRSSAPSLAPAAVRPMVEDALLLIQADAQDARVRIHTDIPHDLPEVIGDRIQIQQVLLNLIRNAIEAISASGTKGGAVRIVVRALVNPERIEFAVHDDGPGLSDDMTTKLFEPLATTKKDGLGLGLPICVSIVEAHGGRFWLRTHESGNTEFRFTLPIHRAMSQS